MENSNTKYNENTKYFSQKINTGIISPKDAKTQKFWFAIEA